MDYKKFEWVKKGVKLINPTDLRIAEVTRITREGVFGRINSGDTELLIGYNAEQDPLDSDLAKWELIGDIFCPTDKLRSEVSRANEAEHRLQNLNADNASEIEAKQIKIRNLESRNSCLESGLKIEKRTAARLRKELKSLEERLLKTERNEFWATKVEEAQDKLLSKVQEGTISMNLIRNVAKAATLLVEAQRDQLRIENVDPIKDGR